MIQKINFTGAKEAQQLAKAIRHQAPDRLWRSVDIDLFKGIKQEDVESELVQNALKETKEKQIFEGAKKGYDSAIEYLKAKISGR